MTGECERMVWLDAGPLGLVSNPRGGPEARACRDWARRLLGAGVRIFVSEVADFEVRRELTRKGADAGLRRLDAVREALEFAPVTSAAMLRASELWAESRRRGRPTASPLALDCDVILAAQALTAAAGGQSVTVASRNGRHLGQFLDARPWAEIGV